MVAILGNLATVMFHLRQFPLARQYLARATAICQETDQKYDECEKIKQLRRMIPGKIGRPEKGRR